jgi:hypothetical protein
MLSPSECLSALASIKCQIAILEALTAATDHANSLLRLSERSGGESLIYDSLHRKKDGSRLKLGTKRTWRYVRVVESDI